MERIKLPTFVRRTLGLRAPLSVAFDTTVKARVGAKAWILTHPDDVRHVLVRKAGNYIKTQKLTSEAGRNRAGHGLLTSSGDEHHLQRRLLQPIFEPPKLEQFCATIQDCTSQMLNSWRDKTEIDIFKAMADLSQSIILRCLFPHICDEDHQTIREAINVRRRYTDYLYHSKVPFRERLNSRIVRQNRSAVTYLDSFVRQQIQIRKNEGDDGSLLCMFLKARYADGRAMSDELVRDEVKTMTSTGYETLGDGLAWSWYLLARNPAVEQRLRQEIDQVLENNPPNFSDYSSLSYVACVFREAMRLYPPTWIFERVPLEPDRLPTGLLVPGGASLYLCPYVMHRNPRVFPKPDSFDPARFHQQKRRAFRFSYFPFGDGVHACLGENFAMLEGVLVLAAMAQQVKLGQIGGQKLKKKAGITLTVKNGLTMQIQKI